MDFHIRDNAPIIDLEDGVPVVQFWFSDCCDIDVMREFASSIDASEKEATLDVGIPIANIADYTIDGMRLGFFNDWTSTDPVRVMEEDRAKLTAIRAALLEAVAKIDRIEYVPNDQATADSEEIYKMANDGRICDVP